MLSNNDATMTFGANQGVTPKNKVDSLTIFAFKFDIAADTSALATAIQFFHYNADLNSALKDSLQLSSSRSPFLFAFQETLRSLKHDNIYSITELAKLLEATFSQQGKFKLGEAEDPSDILFTVLNALHSATVVFP